MAQISVEQFFQSEIRVGRIVQVEDFPKAKKPAYKLWIDFGSLGIKQSSAQITKRYAKSDLQGRQVLAVTNFPPRKIADFISEVLVLGIEVAEGDVILLCPDEEVPLGAPVS
jgi:tRNA-binding protein